MQEELIEKLKRIDTFIFDVDGVMTDGSVIMMADGEALRKMNIKDGYALQLAKKKGYNMAIISGGSSESVRHRFNFLGIYDVYMKSHNKVEVFKEYQLTYDIKAENVLYMGDDIPDYELMKIIGLPCAPANAAEEIKAISNYVSDKNGGEGCVRDVIERVMKLQGKWFFTEQNTSLEDGFKW